MNDKYCPAGKINCSHSYVNDSNDKCCNPNHTKLPVGIGVVVGPTNGFPADEVCRWPSKKEKITPENKVKPIIKIPKAKFLKLSHRERWDVADKLEGVKWYCGSCWSIVDDGIKPRRLVAGERWCDNCDRLLTRRTGGGMNDPFNYFPVKIRIRKNGKKI